MAVLEIKNLSKKYGRKTALKGISCEFRTGINALLGPNGAGKTTIMNCISGVLAKSGGSITLDGQDVFRMGEAYRARLSYQFQYQPFYPSYTARGFLCFIGLLKGMERSAINDEIKKVLSLVNLDENIDDRIKSFSGGMKQRLAIAQTIMNEPEILIFDEPSAGLDPFEREQFKRIMVRLRKKSIIIISTHIVSDIDTICDELILLNKGSVVANDSPDVLCKHIKGFVWDIPKSEITDEIYQHIYFEDDKSKMLSRTQPTENAKLSEPTVNDLYFYCQSKNAFGGESK